MRKILVTGAAGFIGFHLSRRLLAEGNAVVGLDNLNSYYDVTLKQARLKLLEENENFSFRPGGPRRPGGDGRAVRGKSVRDRREPRGPGGRPLFARKPARLHGQQPRRLSEHPRGVPSSRGEAPGVRLLQFRLRGQHPDALFRSRQRGSSAQPLCGHEEGERTDGARLCLPLPAPLHGAAILYRLRTLGKAGHGPLPLHPGDPGEPADRRLQRGADETGFHLHRRHRRGARPRSGADPRAESRLAGRFAPIPPPASPRTGSTTSGTTGPSP